MNFRGTSSREEPEINLIPFIDVLLVVLIFLMLTTTYSKFTELQLNLPVADADVQRDYPKELLVSITSDGTYGVNKVPVAGRDVATLSAALAEGAKAGKETVVVISADASAKHQSVVTVMEAARRAGLVQITFATQSTAQGGGKYLHGRVVTASHRENTGSCLGPPGLDCLGAVALLPAVWLVGTLAPIAVPRGYFQRPSRERPGYRRGQCDRRRLGQNTGRDGAGETPAGKRPETGRGVTWLRTKHHRLPGSPDRQPGIGGGRRAGADQKSVIRGVCRSCLCGPQPF